MELIRSIEKMTARSRKALEQKKKIGFVPTMGSLHAGHLSLVRRAKKECDLVVVSIFVNPSQFGPKEDFAAYPRNLKEDSRLLETVKADILFYPQAAAVYPANYRTYVQIEGRLTNKLCGFYRPEHFKGVTTIVAKLFNMVLPHRAYFGQKDAQQCVVLKKMAAELNFPVKVITLPTVREKDGLALSSRNKYLSPEERRQAPVLYQALRLAKKMIERGERNIFKVEKVMKNHLASIKNLKIQYASVVDGETLESGKIVSGNILIAIAAILGKTRLIDNLILKVKK